VGYRLIRQGGVGPLLHTCYLGLKNFVGISISQQGTSIYSIITKLSLDEGVSSVTMLGCLGSFIMTISFVQFFSGLLSQIDDFDATVYLKIRII
jgi:hypothetical protein